MIYIGRTMIRKRIKYFSYYGCHDPVRHRDNSPAADSKLDYIIDALNHIGYCVEIISLSPSANSKFLSAYTEKKGENIIRYFASFGQNKSPLRIFNRWFMELQFFLWCLINLKREEKVFVYHSLGYDSAFLKLKKMLNIHIIGEIEEIYQDVSKQKDRQQINEYKFVDACDSFLLPTNILDKKINTKHKPSVVIHGVYSISQKLTEKFNDGKIHVVYGGTLDPNKGGAISAAKSAEFLPSNYHVHICGFGDPKEVNDVISVVSQNSKANITFEGELKGNEYNKFIQHCHIGLSTQNPSGAFNDTSFPSKILVYLSNGLKVVTIRIPVVERSRVNDVLFYYEHQDPKEIAEAILKASFVNSDSDTEYLKKLDAEFHVKLSDIIQKY